MIHRPNYLSVRREGERTVVLVIQCGDAYEAEVLTEDLQDRIRREEVIDVRFSPHDLRR